METTGSETEAVIIPKHGAPLLRRELSAGRVALRLITAPDAPELPFARRSPGRKTGTGQFRQGPCR